MDLDLFLLALIESGISTPYQLQKEAGLSQGATIPTLQRLLEAGLVGQGTPGGRRRTNYKVTASGKKTLRSGWRPLFDAGPTGDLDVDLRIALLAFWIGRDHRLASDFLRRASTEMTRSINRARRDSHLEELSPIAFWYSKLRLESAKALLEAKSTAARAMAEALPRRLPGNEVRRTRATKLPSKR
jgi:DNA-binding PadR family transcriptional regulator